MRRIVLLALLSLILPLQPAQADISDAAEDIQDAIWQETGRASYYAARLQGRHTANGERYDQSELTAAHPSLAFGTRVCVTNLYNGRETVVRINDRGPFVGNRIIDLSRQAALDLGMIQRGVARVRLSLCDEENS
ncbi:MULTISPECIES: septal ring lytic transglycosylase RlpA family protein [Halopseudomonas]|uniref:Endolytic peptidoglycan transglycosylase RlpA n=1 Tax=Halopseudomonas pelagia TaxID=553151 RepID=A0AA91U923_9GAMM|nr:septal ring lytic transglycosylase RlpA family protein [Halopseudomonas pelagia]MBQ0741766.1 septal ring lytic transglycosylase RlpA family protein [Pseudomonas sp.]WOD10744.1 septal ring lytic transglycosylase RlpA family protein [Pseudomonas sp. NyZ704]MBQ0778992.1 septal ring lytic transglycosylase RlpA family protein [Pseudomonas sp.]PCD01367.1 septal ring lytic transglycosylase RlpA family lipoprotein [Halopseudomonas pelagia]QFY55817.1 septal ring lytic transglycosylase RlpA family pr